MPRTIKQGIFSAHEDALSTLAAAFPEAVKDGEVDWDALKEILADAPSTGPEKYELTWAGKAEAKREAGRDVVGRTLRFYPEESKYAETTQNLYIEGDNLEVLKLLRENYYGAVKMVYIDPPYNTGNDFVYRDNFSQSEAVSELAEGNIDEEGHRLVKNPKSSNRYHANWLSMIYPRLRLARELLSQDGVIFISIDDNELHNLREICDEVFGNGCFIGCAIWQKRTSPDARRVFSTGHEYILIYARSTQMADDAISSLPLSEADKQSFKNPDNDPRGPWVSSDFTAQGFRPNQMYPITTPGGVVYVPPKGSCWKNVEAEYTRQANEGRFWYGRDAKSMPRRKTYLSERTGRNLWTWWPNSEVGHTQEATQEQKDIFDGVSYFDYPKPMRLLKRIISIATKIDSIVLDFFSGSATTAQAVMEVNSEDSGNRKFICVQFPEAIDHDTDTYKAGYATIAQIAKERIHRVGERLKNQNSHEQDLFSSQDGQHRITDFGFKVFKTADTTIRWTYDALRSDEQMTLDEAAMSDKDRLDFMPGFTDIDVVYEIAMRQNDIPLSAPVRPVPEVGNRTYLFADSILVCLEEAITPELVEMLAAIQPTPSKFILRDSAFEDDIALKDATLRRLQACIARNTKDAKSSYVVDFI